MHGISKEDEDVIVNYFPHISSCVLSSVVSREDGASLIERLRELGLLRVISRRDEMGWDAATRYIREMGRNWFSHIQEDTLRFYCWYYYDIYVPEAPIQCLWDLFTILSQEKPKNERFDTDGNRF